MSTYHVGLIKGCWRNGHRESTLIIQARRNKDNLSPDLWKYLGEQIITKAQLKIARHDLKVWANGYFNTAFTHCVVE